MIFCGCSSASLARDYTRTNCGEGFDLSDLSLTGAQSDLIQAVYATGKPVILVLVSGKPFAISWEKEHIPAIVAQWYGGEQEGYAIADVLFGKVNPKVQGIYRGIIIICLLIRDFINVPAVMNNPVVTMSSHLLNHCGLLGMG